MDFSVILNWILGGGLITAVIGIITMKATVREANAKADEAKANAEKAMAEAETVRIDNAEHATRILIEDILEPLRTELHETREELRETKKEFLSTKREMARLRKAIGDANSCKHADDCPVLFRLRDLPKSESPAGGKQSLSEGGQYPIRSPGSDHATGSDVGSEAGDTNGQPDGTADSSRVPG